MLMSRYVESFHEKPTIMSIANAIPAHHTEGNETPFDASNIPAVHANAI
jgi:hypothetical protein